MLPTADAAIVDRLHTLSRARLIGGGRRTCNVEVDLGEYHAAADLSARAWRSRKIVGNVSNELAAFIVYNSQASQLSFPSSGATATVHINGGGQFCMLCNAYLGLYIKKLNIQACIEK